jgi:Rha family phage regulatory protein
MSHLQNIELTVINGKPITTSRQIAFHFDKLHKNVLQSIRNLDCSPQFNRLNFQSVGYQDNKNERRKEYQIARDGFMYLVMGFTGKRAAVYKEAYINAFNEMERQLHNRYQTVPQQGKPKINDILHSAVSLEKMTVEIAYTKQGDVISINELEQPLTASNTKEASTVPSKLSWMMIVEMLFEEIENNRIPEKMRQNMLIAQELIPASTRKRERHACLFFRAANMMAFFHENPRFVELLNELSIHTTQALLAQLTKAGVLAFAGKEKEKGIPINPTEPSKTRRVSHLVAIDLVVLERDYGVVMAGSGQIAGLLSVS